MSDIFTFPLPQLSEFSVNLVCSPFFQRRLTGTKCVIMSRKMEAFPIRNVFWHRPRQPRPSSSLLWKPWLWYPFHFDLAIYFTNFMERLHAGSPVTRSTWIQEPTPFKIIVQATEWFHSSHYREVLSLVRWSRVVIAWIPDLFLVRETKPPLPHAPSLLPAQSWQSRFKCPVLPHYKQALLGVFCSMSTFSVRSFIVGSIAT